MYHHSLQLQIRFNDVDTQGHVNNEVYFAFYDLGKTTYFQDVVPAGGMITELGVVIRHAEVDFCNPIFRSEVIAVRTCVSRIGNTSFTLMQQVVNTETEEVKCTCRSVMVAYDRQAEHSVPIPNTWIEAFNSYEGRDLRN
jgi:acyl-CoA thioester hydrolase